MTYNYTKRNRALATAHKMARKGNVGLAMAHLKRATNYAPVTEDMAQSVGQTYRETFYQTRLRVAHNQ